MSYDDALSMMNMLANPVTSKPQTDSGISDIKTVMQALEYILDYGPENRVHTIMQLDRIGNFYITKDGYVNSRQSTAVSLICLFFAQVKMTWLLWHFPMTSVLLRSKIMAKD